MRTSHWLRAAPILLAVSTAVRAAGPVEALHRQLPKDPLLALTVPAEELSQKLAAASQWIAGADAPGGTLVPGLAGVVPDAEAGAIAGLLGSIGPEIAAAVDLPDLDALAVALRTTGRGAWTMILARSGILAGVPDEERFRNALRSLAERWPATPADEAGIAVVRIPLSEQNAGDDAALLDVHYAIRGGRLVAGFSREWVETALGAAPAAERLAGGEDFAKVFAHLDERPRSLIYVNLPKLRALLSGSAIVAAVMESSPETRRFIAPLLDPEVMSIGLGSTSVAAAPGVRTTNFGPAWMSGTASSSSLLAALAVPALLVATDRGRARQTLDDIRSIAVACEGYSSDTRAYPGPTRGWVPIGDVAAFLEPIYIPALPRTDAWDNPILYWSNGKSYRILSTGGDGRMDVDWSGVTEPRPSADESGDIVVADGRILATPPALAE